MEVGKYNLADGRLAEIEVQIKAGMSIFVSYGNIEGIPCHWTKEGKYRMDSIPSELDIVGKVNENI